MAVIEHSGKTLEKLEEVSYAVVVFGYRITY